MLFPVETPSEPAEDPDRGPLSARHRPWFERGLKAQKMDWVDPYYSAQWPAFQRLVHQLGERGNRVFVVVGPLNRYMMDEQSAIEFEWWVERVSEWLSAESIPHAVPETLDSSLYGDASHPLTGGYRVLAGALFRDENFRDWLESN